MAERHRAGADPEKRHEAENLAKEAIEEIEHGDQEEGKFLAEEARELDPAAAETVLRHGDEKAGGKSSQSKPSGQAKNAQSGASKSGASKSGASKSSVSKSGNNAKSGNSSRSQPKSENQDSGGHGAQRTTDHDKIRAWVEARNGHPSVVKSSHDTAEGGGILRIDFDKPEASLEEVPWDEFFDIFEERNLAFLYQERTADGKPSRFFKFVRREEEEER